MKRISYDTTGIVNNKYISRIFDIMANVSINNKAERSAFNPQIIEAFVDGEDDARFAEAEIKQAIDDIDDISDN